ncbi:MAG: DegT/DnrJ/EryC1/StrS family aminotransferase [Armatimonadetes bacterium]|nr:DegT/DnrJ/EryC1/StrS family aminotransferase [Armatimonadota bacterium]
MEKLAIDGGPKAMAHAFGTGKKWGYPELKEILDVFDSGAYYRYGGSKVIAFEKAFARAYGVRHAVASTSGTAAIHVALGMLNPEPGSEIITGPITDLGSIVPILYQQCVPVFADTDPQTFCMDPKEIKRLITSRTAAIMVIHLFGNPCDMDAVMKIAREHKLPVIEDCSQAHYTRYKERLCGTIGDIGAFSLQASKHITTGEGGMTITNRKALAERGALFSDKGWARGGWGPRAYEFLGLNYRMTELQGAVGCGQIGKLEWVTSMRNRNGDLLTQLIGDAPGIRPQKVTKGGKHTYWLYGMAVQPDAKYTPQEFAAALSAEGLGAGVGYIGAPIFRCAAALWNKQTFGKSQLPFTLPGVREIEYDESMCPRTQELLNRMITLPMSEFFDERDIEAMAMAIRKVADGLSTERKGKS